MILRSFRPEDAEELAAVYRDAVRSLGPDAYTPEQVEVWAEYPTDIDEFRLRLSRGRTLIVGEPQAAMGFGQLDPMDHIAFLYCRGAYSRKGIGTAIYDTLEGISFESGVKELSVEASRFSRPFFEKKGFLVIEAEQSVRRGIVFERFRMRKKRS